MNAITRQINAMRPKRYTTAQAAHLVGRSTDTLARWRTDGVYFPSDARVFGSTRVYLYTQRDVTAMRNIARHMKPGRKPK